MINAVRIVDTDVERSRTSQIDNGAALARDAAEALTRAVQIERRVGPKGYARLARQIIAAGEQQRAAVELNLALETRVVADDFKVPTSVLRNRVDALPCRSPSSDTRPLFIVNVLPESIDTSPLISR